MTFESGRRLCLLFEAGAARYAVEATAVVEVSPPDTEGQGDKLRGVFELRDLTVLLGGRPEERPGLAVVLDVSPTLALRVRGIVEVADVARAPFFQLPPGMGVRLGALVRGAILHKERLYLELSADALAEAVPGTLASPTREVRWLDAAPDRALVFQSQGRRYALPLNLVLQVVPAGLAYCSLPGGGGAVAGLYAHGQALWPVYSVPGLFGGVAQREELFILAELAGHHVAVCASRVEGVYGRFLPAAEPGAFTTTGVSGAALFLDFQKMFS